MSHTKKVVHISTVHHPLDPRIYFKQCQSLQEAGYDVTLIAPEAEQLITDSRVKTISINKPKSRIRRMLLSTMEAYKRARTLEADYYHIHDPELLPVAWLLKKKGNVVIYDIHEDYETSIMQKEYLPKLLRKVIASSYKLFETVFSSRLELCLAEKYYKEKYPRGTCILNYPVIDPVVLTQQRTGLSVDELIYTGNISEKRGALLQARLPRIHSNISVSFFGKCQKGLAESMYVEAGKGKERMIIEGIERYVPKQEIDEAYQSRQWLAGIALFPYDDHYMKKELTKFFEYMSYGLPIICSDFPVWRTFVETHQCGLAVNPTDEQAVYEAIEYVRTHPEEAKAMGENGKKAVVESLNWQKEQEKLIEWYDQLSPSNLKQNGDERANYYT